MRAARWAGSQLARAATASVTITTPLTSANLPAISPDPATSERIQFVDNQLRIPE